MSDAIQYIRDVLGIRHFLRPESRQKVLVTTARVVSNEERILVTKLMSALNVADFDWADPSATTDLTSIEHNDATFKIKFGDADPLVHYKWTQNGLVWQLSLPAIGEMLPPQPESSIKITKQKVWVALKEKFA